MRAVARLAVSSRRVCAPAAGWYRGFAAAAAGKVPVAKIKELREVSGAPMMDCKRALEDPEVGGDLEKAFDWLRKKGAVTATKKSGRRAAEGLVAVRLSEDNERAVLVEVSVRAARCFEPAGVLRPRRAQARILITALISRSPLLLFRCMPAASQLNSETDFVARNDDFQDALAAFADAALAGEVTEPVNGPPTGTADTLNALLDASVSVGGAGAVPVRDAVVDLVGKIRENLVLRRSTAIAAPAGGVVVPYVHNKARPDMGTIGVAVALSATPAPAAGSAGYLALTEVGKTVALQVAAAQPLALDRDGVDASELERERTVLADQARASGKPEDIIERMVSGRMGKFYAENCLLEQKCMTVEGDKTVKQVVADAKAAVGGDVTVHGFRLLVVGEGVEEGEEEE